MKTLVKSIAAMLLVAFMLMACSTQQPSNKADDVEARLQQLEQEVRHLRKEIEQLRFHREASYFVRDNTAISNPNAAPQLQGDRQGVREQTPPARASMLPGPNRKPQPDLLCLEQCREQRQECSRNLSVLPAAERRMASEKCRQQAQACRQACQPGK